VLPLGCTPNDRKKPTVRSNDFDVDDLIAEAEMGPIVEPYHNIRTPNEEKVNHDMSKRKLEDKSIEPRKRYKLTTNLSRPICTTPTVKKKLQKKKKRVKRAATTSKKQTRDKKRIEIDGSKLSVFAEWESDYESSSTETAEGRFNVDYNSMLEKAIAEAEKKPKKKRKKKKKATGLEKDAAIVTKKKSKEYVSTNFRKLDLTKKRFFRKGRRRSAFDKFGKMKNKALEKLQDKIRAREKRQEALYSDLLPVDELQKQKNIENLSENGFEVVNKVEREEPSVPIIVAREPVTPDMSEKEIEHRMMECLKEDFHHDNFREGQKEAIMNILRGKSTLLILQTGGGKSLTYQMPARLLGGLTICVTPLLALMQDQLKNLPPCLRGAQWSSAQDSDEIWRVILALRKGIIDLLFVSPERLAAAGFQKVICRLNYRVSLVCVDEAHCVSEWSHNFRPSYLRIRKILRDVLRVKRTLALTATATLATENSIIKHLGVDVTVKFGKSRRNLKLTVSREFQKKRALLSLLQSPRFKSLESIIIYVGLKRDADDIAQTLASRGQKAAAYHAGLSSEKRRYIQDAFMNNALRIVCATIAFGMGLDKVDVRAVIHYSVPKTFENYVQEIGRAGRDGNPGQCHAFHSEKDVVRSESMVNSNGVDLDVVEDIIYAVFGGRPKVRKIKGQRLKDTDVRDEGTYVAIDISKIKERWDVREAVVHTILVQLDLRFNLVQQMPSLHNKVGVSFCVSSTELAKWEPLIKYILENSCANKSGKHINRVTELANELSVDPIAIQGPLMQLKSKKAVLLTWKEFSFCVQLKKTNIDVSALSKQMKRILDDHESSDLLKVKTVSQALKLCATDMFHQQPKRPNALHELVDKYFSVKDHSEFLTHIESLLPEDEHIREVKIPKHSSVYVEALIAARKLVGENPLMSVRALARVLHGISSPKYPWKDWCKNPVFGKHFHYPFRQLMELISEVKREEEEGVARATVDSD